jgi:hypothetical protein
MSFFHSRFINFAPNSFSKTEQSFLNNEIIQSTLKKILNLIYFLIFIILLILLIGSWKDAPDSYNDRVSSPKRLSSTWSNPRCASCNNAELAQRIEKVHSTTGASPNYSRRTP